jgi:hypothetical protein
MTMLGARRLAASAVVASLAVAGLSACRSEPSVAAYLGDERIAESRVQDVWDEANDAVTAAGQPAQPGEAAPAPITRADVVRALVGVSVLAEVAKKHDVTLPADLKLAEFATALHVPATTEYIKLYAENQAYLQLLQQGATSAPEPTDADYKGVYDVLVANQGIEPGTTFEAFKGGLSDQNKQLVQRATAVRKEIAEAVGPMDITVNPRYQPLEIPVLQFQTQNGNVRSLVAAPVDEGHSVPVVPAS